MFRACIAFLLLTVGCSPQPSSFPLPIHATATRTVPKIEFNPLRVGWAYEAYPDASEGKLREDLTRMRANGANAVWIGHNNPGEVDVDKVEPGMSYAVYAALQNENDPLHLDAQAMAAGIKRALDAARESNLQVIFPIGYQIQMGRTWNEKYPNELRTNADGTPLNLYNSGYTASPYSERYRQDIARYYQWIQTEWVVPYRDVIVMLSLADEPMGGDYSPPAKQEFVQRYGKAMDTLAADERWQIGEFESGVIADYAAWSAAEWKRLNPGILTTMSFHGGETARRVWGLPDLAKLFAQTPDTFVVTFDAYLHDDLATKPATSDEAAQLKLFLKTIGNYSRIYRKPVAFWGGANAWGLAQESSAPLELTDAMTNLELLYDLPTRVGGSVWGIFAWNYNVKRQGLENYTRQTTYDPQAMEIAVNRVFPRLRVRTATAASQMEAVIVVSPQAMYDALAFTRSADVPPDWIDLTLYARALAERNVAVVASTHALGVMQDVQYYILAGDTNMLDAPSKAILRTRLDEGRDILATDASLAQSWNVPITRWDGSLESFPTGVGTYYLVGINE